MQIAPIKTTDTGLLRTLQYEGDNMEPTINKRDFVTIETLELYQGEGIYAVQIGGHITIKRVQSFGSGLRLSSDNKLYPADDISLEDLNECVVGRVIGAWKPFVSHGYLDQLAALHG